MSQSCSPTTQRTAAYWIEHLRLRPHREGGYYREVARAAHSVTNECGRASKAFSTIYFLLTSDSPSHLHRLSSDETWFHHAGDPLLVHCIYRTPGDTRKLGKTAPSECADSDSEYTTYECVRVGQSVEQGEELQFTVPSGTIFGSSVASDGAAGYAVVSCAVSPSFEGLGFELFTQMELLRLCPVHEKLIRELAYETLPSEPSNAIAD